MILQSRHSERSIAQETESGGFMDRSEHIGELVAALAKAQGEFGSALKDSDNPYYNSKYADLSSVINAVRPALSKHGIALVQTSEADLERQTASVTTSLHCGEQWISCTAEAPAIGKGRKAPDEPAALTRFDVQTIGAVWTYLRRYTLQGLVGVPAEDDDGNSVVGNNNPIPTKQMAPKFSPRKPEPPEQASGEWTDALAEADTLEKFNVQVVPLMKEKGNDFIKFAAAIAKQRGYKPNRATGLYEMSEEIA
jgi:hypothetical protein